MFVEVIVDIKNSNVDRSYYYKVPVKYSKKDYIGYRVEVSFGSRLVQGYIINQTDKVDFDPNKCKEIKNFKDEYPVLTKELILLSDVLADELYCTRIQVIESMLPTILKNKYQEYYKLEKIHFLSEEEKKLFLKSSIIEKKKLDEKFSSDRISELLSNSTIKLISLAQDQLKKDRDIFYVLEKNILDISLTKKQEKVVSYLLNNKEIKKTDIKETLEVGIGVIKKLQEFGIIKEEYREKKIVVDTTFLQNKTVLNEHQDKVYKEISRSIKSEVHSDFLLHGVTGSGKTEIYIKLVEDCIKLNKEAIILIPEIILTPQIEKKFRKVFGENIAIIHSRLSKKEKYQEWKKIKDSKVKICLGTRSSIFAPFENLGLIIIDEEHESTYKQQETPRYDAKDVAKKRSIYNKACVVYASATPTVDLYYDFKENKSSRLLKLLKRYNDSMPDIEVIPLENKKYVISDRLLEEIKKTINKQEQVLLFINKRGYTNFIRCFSCGHVYNCENCDISLNYHKKDNSLQCHFCGFKKRISDISKCCEYPDLVSGVYGIQKIEEYIKSQIENVRIIRMDSDTTSRKGAYEKLLTDFRNKKADILLGTQMISKGLDFPDITLVGVLSVDSMVSFATFKSNERIFQLLVQTAGRAGRSKKKGKVIIQSNMDSNVIDYAVDNDYSKLYNYEINRRSIMKYPPFSKISFITIKGLDEVKTAQAATSIYNFLYKHYDSEKILGPSKSVLYRINNEYKYNIVVRFSEDTYSKLHKALKYIHNYFSDAYSKDKISISIDNSAHDYV